MAFDESKHPRDEEGKFTDKESSGNSLKDYQMKYGLEDGKLKYHRDMMDGTKENLSNESDDDKIAKEEQQKIEEVIKRAREIPRDEVFEKKYFIAENLTKETATKDNFYLNSIGFWDLAPTPDREADHISINRSGGISSQYWYTEEGVYRRSDHWGAGVASCSWFIKGRDYKTHGVQLGETETAFISWKDLKAKGLFKQEYDDEGIPHLTADGFVFKKMRDWGTK